MMSRPTLYDLFGSTSLYRWERLVNDGKLPTKDQLAEIIEANRGEPLPTWLIELVLKGLRGQLKQRAGRPKQHPFADVRFAAAQYQYARVHRWLRKRELAIGLTGWSILRQNDWWKGPPHERAARIVTARWLKHMNWRSFLNKVSS